MFGLEVLSPLPTPKGILAIEAENDFAHRTLPRHLRHMWETICDRSFTIAEIHHEAYLFGGGYEPFYSEEDVRELAPLEKAQAEALAEFKTALIATISYHNRRGNADVVKACRIALRWG